MSKGASFGFMAADRGPITFVSRTRSNFVYTLKSLSESTTLMIEGSNSNAQIIVVKITTYGELGTYSSNFNGNNVGSSALYFNIN
jgi:hypothetical protein